MGHVQRIFFSILLAVATGAHADGKFVVHEWGTFTSVQGSNGQALGGMSHEEEQLPPFVVGRNPLNEPDNRCRFSKSVPVCPDSVNGAGLRSADVTQKMETPVLYFHSDRDRAVSVNVEFPTGLISQYYPAPTAFSPPLNAITRLGGGFAHFEVELTSVPLALPSVAENSVYRPARDVQANYVRAGAQNEKFIFYRGLGAFATDLAVTSAQGQLTLNNRGTNLIAAAFILEVTAHGSFVRRLGALMPGESKVVTVEQITAARGQALSENEFLATAGAALNLDLERSGLFRDEAAAMTNTWKNSYFKNPGLRVLYVLSREETDRLLPLRITPAPQEVVRTLVGRIEVMTDLEEARLLSQPLQPESLGRFAEPKLRRLLQLSRDTTQVAKIRALLDRGQ